jgi:GDP-4-dehydro-6-deoxy-D-mannose reductase
MKVVVVGAGGFIGRHLCTHLKQRGDVVLALSSSAGCGIDSDSGLWQSALELPGDAEAVVFLAQSPWSARGDQGAEHVMRVNCLSAIAAAQAARRAAIPRMVYMSTGNVYADSFVACAEDAPLRVDNWYSLSKVHAEQALAMFRPSGLAVHIVRLFGGYGPHQDNRLVPRLLSSVVRGETITLAPRYRGEPAVAVEGLRLSLTFIADVVGILSKICASGGPDVVNLAGNEIWSVRDMALEMGRQIGRAPCFEIVTAPRQTDLIADVGLLDRSLAPCPTPFRSGLSQLLTASSCTSALELM